MLNITLFKYCFYQRTNWISNLPSPPKNVYPSQVLKTQDTSKQRHPSLSGTNQTANHRGVDDWKENKNKYAPPRSTPVDSSSTRPSVSVNLNNLLKRIIKNSFFS